MRVASVMFLMLLVQTVFRACSRARAKTGKRMAAKIAIIAITTSSSMRVKPCGRRSHSRFIRSEARLQYIGGPPWILWLIINEKQFDVRSVAPSSTLRQAFLRGREE